MNSLFTGANNPMLFEEMSIFATIAEEGGFTAAAKKLKRSKAYISQKMNKLEDHLGLQLLFRTTRKVSLTEVGRDYLIYCQDITKTAEHADRMVASMKGEMTGRITVSAPYSFGEIMISEVLLKFQDDYPTVQVDLDLSNEIRNLKTDNVDMTIRGGRVIDDDLVAIPLIKRQQLVVATREYLNEFGVPQLPEDLLDHNCVGFRYEMQELGWKFLKEGELVRMQVDGKFSVNSNSLIKKLALKSQGLALIPSYVIHKELQSGELVQVLTDYCEPAFSFYLSYVYQKNLAKKNRVLIDYIKDYFKSYNIEDGLTTQ